MTRRSAALWLLAVVLPAGSAARPAWAGCGEARPSLAGVTTAEGLVVGPDGTLYFSQPFVGPNSEYLGRHRPPYDRPPELHWAQLGGNALGITLDPQRNVLYAGSRTLKKLLKVSLDDVPAVSVLAEAEEGINGLTLGDDGAVYYSDQGGGHLYRVTAEGTKTRVTTSPLPEPNGLAFGPDKQLYVVSWTSFEVMRLTLAGGVESQRGLFATLPQVKGDGIAFDAQGHVYVTAASTLYEISPDGAQVTPLGRTPGANIEFGTGALGCADMYIAGNGQGIRLFRHDTPGLDVPWHRRGPEPSASAAAAPQIAFPGQYAPTPAAWRFPAAPNGCSRFVGEERACFESVALDFGRLGRFAGANRELGPAPPRSPRVVFFGDSITDNWSRAGFGGFFPGKPYVNRGIGGQTTAQMLLRFRPDVIALQPAAVVILAGTNDVAGNAGPVSLDTIEQNLATFAELARLHHIQVVLASLLPVSDDKRDRSGHALVRTTDRPPATLQSLNTWLADYARRNGHVYLDYFSAVAGPDGAFKPELNDDGLHPNAAGYAVMAPLAEKAIAMALRGRRGVPRSARGPG